ncbi:hypothetical protein GGI04_000782 [Coemansia thaxteri]|nr:hypothetical protein GGI04_000782 [Coemansia thaxteri]
MYKTKPEAMRSLSTESGFQQAGLQQAGFQQAGLHQGGIQASASLVSLPMLARPSTGAAPLALGVGAGGGFAKRPRVNSKALGSLFRAKVHAKRSSHGDPGAALQLGAADGDAWAVGIECPSAMSPLFSDESLQQLLGSTAAEAEAPAVASPGSRRTTREFAASVLQTSAGPFRRLRQAGGGASRTMSFPPALCETLSLGAAAAAGDEFVVVTPDMCPPAALVNTSVISGVGGLAASASRKRGSVLLRTRAQTHVDATRAYGASAESLVPVSAPSLSASSSEVSLPRARLRRLPPLLADKEPLADDGRRLSHMARLECLSPYTVSRLSSTAARATERRRRSSVRRRSRASSDASSANWPLSDGATLKPAAGHARNRSEQSEYSVREFQIASARSASFWPPGESPLPSDDDAARLDDAEGFPTSSSACFPMSPRRHASMVTRSADEIRLLQQQQQQQHYAAAAGAAYHAQDVRSLLDPTSPLHGPPAMPLHVLARARASTGEPAPLECVDELSDVPVSPGFSDHGADFDGLTLTQHSDWQLMNPSSSDSELPLLAPRPRRLRKRRVLPRTLFHMRAKGGLPADERMYAASASSDTLPAADEAPPAVAAAVPVAAEPVVPAAPLAACSHSPGLAAAVVPRVPPSLVLHVHAECLGRLALHSPGDSSGWEPRRIACFALRLGALLERAAGLTDVRLVNLGLTTVPPRVAVCRGLRRLDLSHNWIAAVPAFLARLPALRHIIVRGNPVRTVPADLVEMRHRLETLDFGAARRWALLSRRAHPAASSPPTPAERAELLYARLRAVANRRMAQCIDAPRLALTQRQHEAALDRATKLLALYTNALYSTLREPRDWGHSVALPRPCPDLPAMY